MRCALSVVGGRAAAAAQVLRDGMDKPVDLLDLPSPATYASTSSIKSDVNHALC